MSSLTQVAITSRKIIRYSIYFAVFIVIFRYTYKIGLELYRRYRPEPPPPPTLLFDKLPPIPFPSQDGGVDLVFTLETADLKLPSFPTQLTVYLMPKPISTIKSLDLAKQKAASLGFGTNGRELVETVYLFTHPTSPASLNLNIVTGIFSISYDLNSRPTTLENIPPTPEKASALAKTYLTRARSMASDLSGEITHSFIKIENGNFIETNSLSDANITKINLYRKEYNDLPNVTSVRNQSNVWFMFSGAQAKGDQVIAAEYHHFAIDENKNGTYPIKTAEEAWEDLKSGRGYVADLGNNPKGAITIRRVYLAYYDPGQYTEYYQPVVVFEGDNNFVAYIPAVINEYIQSE